MPVCMVAYSFLTISFTLQIFCIPVTFSQGLVSCRVKQDLQNVPHILHDRTYLLQVLAVSHTPDSSLWLCILFFFHQPHDKNLYLTCSYYQPYRASTLQVPTFQMLFGKGLLNGPNWHATQHFFICHVFQISKSHGSCYTLVHFLGLGESCLIHSGQCTGEKPKFSGGSVANLYLQTLEH